MINVSDAFKNELNNDNRLYLAYATITLSDGTRLSVTNEHIWANGVKIEESVSDSSSFSIGSAIASKLTLTLNNVYGDFTDYVFDDALVNIQIGLQLPNGTIEKVNRGNYVVTEAVGQNTSLVTLECLDYMYKFNKPYSEVQTIYPSSMGTIVHDICSYCGVTLSTQNFPRHDLMIPNRPEDEALSCLDVISYISQIACCFARINNSNQLVIEWYDTNDITTTEKLITKSAGDYITTKSGDYIVVLTPATDEDFIDGNIVTKIHRIQHTGSHTVQMDDVVITGIRVTNKRDQDTVSALAGTEGYVLDIDENPFIQEGYEGTVADLIGERCIGMRFRPLSVTTLNDPTIEAGDRMYFISPIDNAVYKSYVTSTTFAIDDWQDLRCDAETPARNSATKYGAATKSFVALRKMVQNETSSREEALRELSIKVDNSSGLYMTAEEQPDGSFIYYQHDKPTIAESSIIWKETAETRTVSTDGGQTWNAGITADGDAIVRLLQAEGINADWINAGTLVIRDNNNNIIFSASKESSTSGGSVFIGAGSVIIGGYNQVQSQSMSDALDSVKTYSDGQLTAYSQQVAQAFDDIQAQLDGQIDSWYYNYNPTLNNAPASDWTTEELKQEHEGDTFTNVDTGDAWRFIKENNTWIWKVIADTAAAAALAAAQKAQQTADNKIRNFMNVPTPPYEEGDFWIKSDGTILICTNGKESGQAYSVSDWEEKVKYTDDTVANQALEEARRAQALNVVLSNEYDSIPTDADGNYTTFPSGIQTTVQTFLGHNDITTQCTYAVNTSSAITGTWNANTKTYVVTGLSADTGWVDVSATYLNSLTATKRFTVAKVRQGIRGIQGTAGAKGDKGDRGDPGASGRVYILEPSTAVLSRSAMGDVTPSSITWKAYYRDGDEARQPYAGRFKIEESADGQTWTTAYTSSQDETSCSYTTKMQLVTKANKDKLVTKANKDKLVGPHITATNVRCTLYHSGGVVTVLDQQSTPVVDDTAGLTVILSNEAVSVTADSDGMIPNYGECFTYLQVYYGNTHVSDYASYSTPVVSSGLTGTWDATTKCYRVTHLTPDDGYVDFTVSYKGASVTRRFTISKSKNGVSMIGTTELYALGNSPTTAPADSAFTEGIKTPTSSNKYLWNMERILYSDNSYSTVDKHIVAIYGETGATGVGIQNIENYYAISNSTTAPADSAFDTNVKATTSSNKYLWNYEVTIYSDGSRHKTDKRIIGTYGDKGDKGDKGDSGLPGRVYIVESSANVITKDAKGNTSPDVITFNAYYRDGSSARESYAGRFKIESSTDGTSWTTVYTSSANESSCRYVLRHQLVTKKNKYKLITKKQGNYIIGPHVDGTMFRCTLYQAGGTTVAQDQQTVPVVTHTTGLTVVLSNETVSVTAETDGTIPDYKECFTDVQAFYGNADVTSLATYTVTRSSGLTGTWDGVNKRYTVTNLTPDDGYVDITITYKEVTVTRRFTVSKSKDGVWQNNVVELYALNNDANTPPADNAFTEGIKTPSETQRFLWNQERMIYSNGETLTLEKHLVAMYGETGNGIANVEEFYALSATTIAPTDSAFTKEVQTPTNTNKYLWNYELITYTSGDTKKTDKHIVGAYGDKGDRYYLEFSSKILKIGKNGAYVPSSVVVSLRQVTGNTGVATAFTGRLKVVEWKNGQQKVIRLETATALSTYTYIPSEANIDFVKFEMYNYINSAYTLLDQESVQCMIDFDALTQEDVFNVLTNNGAWQGIYKESGTGNYYLNFTFAKGGGLVLGGLNNTNGTLEVKDASDKKIVEATNEGIKINKGSFTIKDGNNKTVFGVTSAGVLTSISGSIGGIKIADGKIYTGDKTSFDSNKTGFCLESDGDFVIGSQNSYMKFQSTSGQPLLEIKGKIVATTGTIGGISIEQSSIHTENKTAYNDEDAGFYVDNNGYFGLGNKDSYLRWNGSTLEASGAIKLGSNSSISIADKFLVDSSGELTAKAGTIGSIKIESTSIHSGTKSSYNSSTAGFYMDSDGKFDVGNSTNYLQWSGTELKISGKFTLTEGSSIEISSKFKVDSTGKLTAESGTIGGFTIESNKLYYGKFGDGNADGFYITPKGYNGTVCGTTAQWVLAVRSHFGVTGNGDLYCNSGSIGKITIASDNIHSGNKTSYNSTSDGFYLGSNGYFGLGDGTQYIRWDNSTLNISGKLVLARGSSINIHDDFTVTAGGYMTAKDGKIGGWTIDATSLSSGNFTLDATNSRITLNNNCYIYSDGDAAFKGLGCRTLDVVGSSGVTTFFSVSANYIHCYNQTRIHDVPSYGGQSIYLSNTNTITFASGSSIRYKEIDREISHNDLSDTYKVKTYFARYKKSYAEEAGIEYTDEYTPMLIAEEIDKYMHKAVVIRNGEIVNWEAREMIPYHQAMIIDQKERNDDQDKKIMELMFEIEELKKQLNHLN